MTTNATTTLITGGAGFIGSHLCDRLIKAGDDVLCLDNFYTGSKDNIRHLLAAPNFELIRHDIWLPIYLEVDRIFNLACPASPVHYQNDPIATTKIEAWRQDYNANHPHRALKGLSPNEYARLTMEPAAESL